MTNEVQFNSASFIYDLMKALMKEKIVLSKLISSNSSVIYIHFNSMFIIQVV